MTNKERFLNLCSRIKRPGIDKLLEWLENSDFYECPASSRFHGAYKGGLLEHSLNVYDHLCDLLDVYREIMVPEESVIISTLFHDLCKVNYYTTEKRNRKNAQGKWESYDAYTIKEKFCFGGHGSKSVFIVDHFIELTPEEAVAINCHMGAFTDDWRSVGSAFEMFPFAWLVSVADQGATYITESTNKQTEV